MKLRNIFRNIFRSILNHIFRKNAQEIESRLVALKDIVPLPTRANFLSCPKKLKQIDEYMGEYLTTLKRDKTIVSIDLMPKELHDYKDIYSNLLINLTLEDDSEVSFERVNVKEAGNEYLDIIIKKIKIALYQYEVSRLREEAELRIAALLEILNNKVFSKNKTDALLNEINNLHYALVIFLSEEEAMRKEAYAYLKDIEGLDDKEFLSEGEKEELIRIRLKETREIAELLIPEKLRDLEKKHLSPELLLAKLEQLLEIYVYTHSEELNSLRDEINYLSYKIQEPVLKSYLQQIKDEYLERIKVLELKYKAFSKYGRNMVNKEDLIMLYQIKFKILTNNISHKERIDLVSDVTYTELECYQDIISKKIEKILKGENNNVNHLANDSTSLSDVINLIKEVLKQDEEFSFYCILSSHLLLSFLLSFDNRYDLEEFFKNFKIHQLSHSDVNYYECIGLFSWDQYLPLATIYNIMTCNIETNTYQYKSGINYDPLYEIYKLALPTFLYRICFEGLKTIQIPTNVERMPSYVPIIEYIRKKAKGKEIYMPSTLQSFYGNLFADCGIKALYLNDGLEVLEDKAIMIPGLKQITFPSSIKSLFLFNIDFRNFESIGIKDYSHSFLMNDNELARHFIKKSYIARKTDQVKYHRISDFVRKKQKAYKEGRYSAYADADLFDHEDTITGYKLEPAFDTLDLYDSNNQLVATLNKEELTIFVKKSKFYTKRYYLTHREDTLDDYEANKVIDHIRSKITEKLSLKDNTDFSRVRKK